MIITCLGVLHRSYEMGLVLKSNSQAKLWDLTYHISHTPSFPFHMFIMFRVPDLPPILIFSVYCSPRDTSHIPLSPSVHQVVRVRTFNLYRFRYLSKHCLIFESPRYLHLKLLHCASVHVSAVFPQG